MTTTNQSTALVARVVDAVVVLPVIMEDAPLHTAENGYQCLDATCPCNADLRAGRRVNYRRAIPEYPGEPQETNWYEC